MHNTCPRGHKKIHLSIKRFPKINKLILLFCLLLLAQKLSAQQFLWITTENTGIDYIPIKDVTKEVLDFYDFYEYYSDGTGYSRSNFLKILKRYNDNTESFKLLMQSINQVEELTVIALKDNLGQGSVVLVVIINSRGVDIVAFTNNFELDAINTTVYDNNKFEKWFISLLN